MLLLLLPVTPQALRTMAPGLLGSLPKGGDIKLSEYAFPTQTKITDRLEQLKQPLQMANKMGSFGLQVRHFSHTITLCLYNLKE
jgi:hypothetical protein